MAATNKTFWGQCQEEIEWARMRKTSGCKKRHERIKTAKLMHGKRGTLDYLQKFDISDTNICIMCKQKKETNMLLHTSNNCGTETKRGSSHPTVDKEVWRHTGNGKYNVHII